MRSTIVVTLLMVFALSTFSQESNSIGVGFGAHHSGLGASYQMPYGKYFLFLSAGASGGYSERDGFLLSSLGTGVGLLRADLFKPETKKHAFGVFVGALLHPKSDDAKYDVYLSPEYRYYFSGIENGGWNIGTNLLISKSGAGLGLQFGYDF